MTAVLGFDTATPDTVVALAVDGGEPPELRHTPAPGERPGHARAAPAARPRAARPTPGWASATSIASPSASGRGRSPACASAWPRARALAQATGAELCAISTLRALAAASGHDGPVLAVLDARRGEAFAAAWDGDERLCGPVAVAPEALPGLVAPRSATPGWRWGTGR